MLRQAAQQYAQLKGLLIATRSTCERDCGAGEVASARSASGVLCLDYKRTQHEHLDRVLGITLGLVEPYAAVTTVTLQAWRAEIFAAREVCTEFSICRPQHSAAASTHSLWCG